MDEHTGTCFRFGLGARDVIVKQGQVKARIVQLITA